MELNSNNCKPAIKQSKGTRLLYDQTGYIKKLFKQDKTRYVSHYHKGYPGTDTSLDITLSSSLYNLTQPCGESSRTWTAI